MSKEHGPDFRHKFRGLPRPYQPLTELDNRKVNIISGLAGLFLVIAAISSRIDEIASFANDLSRLATSSTHFIENYPGITPIPTPRSQGYPRTWREYVLHLPTPTPTP